MNPAEIAEGIVLEGFEREVVRGEKHYPQDPADKGHDVIRFTRGARGVDQVEVRMVVYRDKDGSSVTGHIEYDSSKGRRTFDRYGVEDSFYIMDGDTTETVMKSIRSKLERIEKSRDTLARSVQIPGIPFMVTPERKAEVEQLLRKGQPVSFTPSGFGTGYRLVPVTKKLSRKAQRWLRRPPEGTAEFFGFSPGELLLDTMDCD